MFASLLSFVGGNDAGKNAIKAILLAGTLSVIVRIFGFIKESTIAYYFGISNYVDFYVLAMIYVTFFVQPIGGAVATLLTQKYIEVINIYSQNIARHIYFKCLLLSIICISIILLIQSFFIQIPIIKIWFLNKFPFINLNYIYILIPIGLFSVMSLINSSILMAKEQFKTHSFLPISIHFTIITFLFLSPAEYMVQFLLIGTLFGYFIEFIISKFCLREVFVKFNINEIKKENREFNKIFKSIPKMVLSSTILCASLVVDQIMAILAGEGAIATINFGNKVPLGIISIITICGTVLYPTFIKYATASDYNSLRKIFLRFSTVSFVMLFLICGSISIFSESLTRILFERGAFLATDTVIVSNIQILYLMLVPLFVVSMICMRVINALENTRVYLLGNILLLIMNIILNLFLIPLYGVIGVPLATLVSYGFVTLFWIYKTNQLVKGKEQGVYNK